MGGVHPSENKLSCAKPIEVLPLPDVVTIPLAQHIGAPAVAKVAKGDRVLTGQLIAEAGSFMSANIHSPISGTVTAVDMVVNGQGLRQMMITIKREGDDWAEGIDRSETIVRECTLSAQEIVARIKDAGIVGMGGATFPTHVKITSGIGKVNAAVCTQVLIDHFGVDYIINTGCAGAIHPELGIGDILISTDAVQHDMDVSALGDPIGTIPRLAESYFKADEMLVKLAQEAAAETAENYHVILGRVASGDKFIGTKEGKEHIKRYVQGDCAEGAAIAHACWLNRIPFVIIRAISDSADEQANMSYEQFVLLAAKRSSELVEKILEKLA